MQGRAEIYTDVPKITYENVIDVLTKAMITHGENASRCSFLLNYEGGNQPINRKKTYRPNIDNKVVDNIANEVTDFKCGFVWGNPITLVQRGIKDSGKQNENEGIALLNEYFAVNNSNAVMQEIARYVEICGVGNELIEINSQYTDGDAPFTTIALDPRFSFVIKSSYYLDHRPMMGVTFRVDDSGARHFTCITDTDRFEILNMIEVVNGKKTPVYSHVKRSGEKNPFGLINIIEWQRSYDRQGCFERQIAEMDALNLQASDFVNDVDQNTQSIWHGNDIAFPVDENGEVIKPSSGDWMLTQTTADGKTPFVKPLSTAYDYAGMLNNYLSHRALILQKCCVPQRNDNSGGSTGIAMSDATGWSSAEMSASKQQALQEYSKMQEVRVVLEIIKKSTYVPADSPVRELRVCDVQPNIKRQKTYEITTKINAYATGVKHGIAQLPMLKVINLFDDPQEVADDSKESFDLFIESTFKQNESNTVDESVNSGRLSPDESDQIDNSPMIDK